MKTSTSILIISLLFLASALSASAQIAFPLASRIPSNYSNASMVALLHMNGTDDLHINASDSPYRPGSISRQNSPTIRTACVPYGSSGTNGGCGNFISETNGYLLATAFTPQVANRHLTFGSLINISAIGAGANYVTAKLPTTDSTRVYAYVSNVDSKFHIGLGNSADLGGCSIVLGTNNWIHWAVRVNVTAAGIGNASIFVNGTKCFDVQSVAGFNPSADNWNIGFHPSDGVDFDGEMSEYFIFNYTMNDTEIQCIYNGTFPCNAPAPASLGGAKISVHNIANNSFVNFTNATLNNGTFSFNFTTDNGTIQLHSNITGFYNISLRTKDHFDLFFENFNISPTGIHNFTAAQGKLNVSLRFIITQSIARNFTVKVGSGIFINMSNSSGADDDIEILLAMGINTLNFSGLNMSSSLANYTLTTPITNDSRTFNTTNKRFTFQARDHFTSQTLSTFNVTLYNTTWGYVDFYQTTSGTILINLENVSLIAEVRAFNYSTTNFSISDSTNFSNTTFPLLRANTVNITVFYEPNRLPILNGSILILLVGENYATNMTIYNTSGNTTGVFNDVPSGIYDIRYWSGGFEQRSKFVTVSSTGYANADLYLLDTANSTTITYTIDNQFGNKQENLTIKALRYYVDINGYIEVEACKTNLVGQCQHKLVKSELGKPDVYYKLVFEYQGRIVKETEAFKITSTTYSFTVNTGIDIVQDFQDLTIAQGNVSFINTTNPNYFRYTFTMPDGVSRRACLTVTKKLVTGDALVGTNCVTGSAGSMIVNINQSEQTVYVARGDATFASGNVFTIATLDVNLIESFKTFYTTGLLMVMILIATMAAAVIESPFLAIIFTLVASGAMLITGFWWAPWASIVILVILGGIIAFKGRT